MITIRDEKVNSQLAFAFSYAHAAIAVPKLKKKQKTKKRPCIYNCSRVFHTPRNCYSQIKQNQRRVLTKQPGNVTHKNKLFNWFNNGSSVPDIR